MDVHAVPPLLDHVGARAAEWFPELPARAPEVGLVWTRARHQSTLHRIAVEAGRARRDVVVKETTATAARRGRDSDRPRLVPVTEGTVRHGYEQRAMRAAAGIGAVRVLDHLPARGAIVLEHVADPTARDLLLDGSRIRRTRPVEDLDAVIERAGGWLRAFHQLDFDCTTALDDADEASQVLQRLAEHAGDRGLSRRVCETAAAELVGGPVGPAHGDYAPRNVFVAPGGDLRVFDVLGRWRAPTYLDVAYFTVSLRTAALQVATFGRGLGPGVLERLERAFLRGYFGDAVPFTALAAAELFVLADKRAADLAGARAAASLHGRAARQAYRALAAVQLRRRAAELTPLLEQA